MSEKAKEKEKKGWKRKLKKRYEGEVKKQGMGYYCMRCKRSVKIDDESRGIRCPYCGYRALRKDRPGVITKVKAE